MLNPKNIDAIFKALPVPCILLRVDFPRFTIAGVNDAFCLALHTRDCDLINKGIFDVFPGIPDELKSSLELVIAAKVSHRMTVQKYNIPVNGIDEFEVKYWSQENSPVLNEQGEVEFIIHSLTDVTEILKAKEQSELEKTDKEALINNTDDLIWSLSSDFKLVAANTAFIQSLESYAGITVKPGDDLMMRTIFPDDYLTFWQKAYTRALSGETFKEEIFTPEINNSVNNWSEISFNPIYKNDTVVGIACYSRNITERKLADEQLRQSEGRLAEAQSVAKVGSWETDLLNLNVIWSEETYRIFEIDPTTFTSHPDFLEFVHPEDKEKVETAFVDSLDKNSVTSIEHRIITPDGSLKTVNERWRIFRNDLEKPIRAVGTCQDISDFKKSEQLIRESEAKYRAFFENSMDGILLSVTEGQIVAANPAACEIFGMTEKEICDAGRFGLVDMTDPRLRLLLEERQLKGKAKGEITLVRKNGSKFPGELTSSVFEDSHGETKTSMIIRDITERKKADKELVVTSNALKETLNDLKRIMDSSLDIICSIDEEGRFVNVSAASETIWGYRPQELRGRKYMDFVFPEDALNTSKVAAEIMNGVPVTIFENRYIHKDGRVVPILWSARWDDNEKLIYCIAKDASEKKRSERAYEIEKQRFQDLYLQAPSCMGILKGPNHVFEMANPLYLQLIGESDIIGKTVKEVLPELEAQGIFEFLDTVYKTGNTFSANEMLVQFDHHKNGNLVDKYLNFIYQAHRDNEGNIDGIFFFAIDVTEQVLSRKKIEENKKHYEELIQELPVATYSCDAEGHILIYNKAAAELWGREPEIGKDLWCGSWKIYTTDGNLLPLDTCAMAVALKEGRLKTHKEIIIERPNGDKRNVVPHPVPLIDSSGRVTGAVNMLTDITEIKAAEQHLKLLESVITHTNDAVMITEAEPFDEPGPRILYVNEAFTKMTGYSFEEIIGKSPRILQGPKSDMEALKRLSNSIRKWEPCEITVINYKKNGEEFWINFSVSPVANEKGWFTHWISIERDVTESKRIEQKISDERALLRTLIDNLPDTIYFKDASARKLISNKVDYELLGAATEEEVLHKTDLEILQNELTISGYHQDMEVLNTGRPLINFEQYFIRENGIPSWFLTTKIALRNEKDEIVGLLGIGRDITVRKQYETALELNEKRFKALVQEGSDLISILDENKHYKYSSPAYTTILGINHEDLIGSKALNRIHKDDKERVFKTSERLKTEKRVHYLPYRYKDGNNQYRWLESIATNLMDDPSVRGFLFNSKDVTERINYIQAIEAQNAKLTEIAWMQSHIVRAPLSRIMGLIDLLNNYSQDPKETSEILGHVITSAYDLDNVIREIVKKAEQVENREEK